MRFTNYGLEENSCEFTNDICDHACEQEVPDSDAAIDKTGTKTVKKHRVFEVCREVLSKFYTYKD